MMMIDTCISRFCYSLCGSMDGLADTRGKVTLLVCGAVLCTMYLVLTCLLTYLCSLADVITLLCVALLYIPLPHHHRCRVYYMVRPSCISYSRINQSITVLIAVSQSAMSVQLSSRYTVDIQLMQ